MGHWSEGLTGTVPPESHLLLSHQWDAWGRKAELGHDGGPLVSRSRAALQINSCCWRFPSNLWFWSPLLTPRRLPQALFSLYPGHLPSQQTSAFFLPAIGLVLSGWSHPGTVSAREQHFHVGSDSATVLGTSGLFPVRRSGPHVQGAVQK